MTVAEVSLETHREILRRCLGGTVGWVDGKEQPEPEKWKIGQKLGNRGLNKERPGQVTLDNVTPGTTLIYTSFSHPR